MATIRTIVGDRRSDTLHQSGNSTRVGLRSLISHAVALEPTAPSLQRQIEWLRASNPTSQTRLPRYLEAIYLSRDDLRAAFPEVLHGELVNFSRWVREWGWVEYPSIRLLGTEIPTREVSRAPGPSRDGVDVVGFLHAEHGVGESARLLFGALQSVGVPASALAYANTRSRQNVHFDTVDVGEHDVVLTALNAELNAPLRESFGEEFFRDRYVIGQWFWELSEAPPWYSDNYRYINELWAPTRFIEDMLRRDAPQSVEIRHMPLPLRQPHSSVSMTKTDLGIPERFMFFFSFDFMSVMKRKNPVGLVSAFKRAFSNTDEPVLVLKSINGETRPVESEQLRAVIGDATNIVWLDRYFDSDQSAALMSLCDCYVSLHRSEGLGLTIAEAMLLGKPVIATGYSGNLDYMTPETSYLVPWKLTKVGRGAEGYPRRATWAEPDLREAARLMRHVWQHQEEARAVGDAARRDLSKRFTLETCGARMKARLEEIRMARHGA